MARPSAVDRIARILAIVPWIAGRDGPTVAEVCERFAIDEASLLADLDLVFLCGLYPYTPENLIEVQVEDGRVWIEYTNFFERPLRLTQRRHSRRIRPAPVAEVDVAHSSVERRGIRVAGIAECGHSQPCRRVGGVHRESGARHADRLGKVAALPQLFGELGEQPGAWIAFEAAPQFVDSGVSHGSECFGAGPGGPAPPHCSGLSPKPITAG